MATVDQIRESTTTSVIHQIGETAGEVWHTLLQHEELTLTQLTKEINAPRDRVMQAVGWLAREDKIRIEERARKRIISLN